MPHVAEYATLPNVRTVEGTDVLVLEEFRLHAADTGGAAAALIAAASDQVRDPVPLLTSIDDPRDVATLRTVKAGTTDDDDPRGHAVLGALVANWKPVRRYRPRIAAHSRAASSSSFRLAVTESGINDEGVPAPGAWVGEPTAGEPIALLLVGIPEGTHAGLLVLVGRDSAGSIVGRHSGTGWPLPLSRDLGVRVYESSS